MVELHNLHNYSLGLLSGKYTSEQVVAFFRGVYGPEFTSHDLTLACKILSWRIQRRSGKSDFIIVK